MARAQAARLLEPEQGGDLPRGATQARLGPVHRLPQLLHLALEGEQLLAVGDAVVLAADQLVAVVLDGAPERERLVREIPEVECQPPNEHRVRHSRSPSETLSSPSEREHISYFIPRDAKTT